MAGITSAGRIAEFFRRRNKYVITFAGFGELGYEDPTVLAQAAEKVLGNVDPGAILVNAGTLLRAGGQDGVAEIFHFARNRGIETTGIHPSVALRFRATHYPSPYCDHVFFVEDDTWGGFLNGSDQPSPTLGITLEVSGELVVIGGGKHAAEELDAFSRRAKTVRYFPAEMNRSATREWCARSGASIVDYRGDAHTTWLRLREQRPRFGLGLD